MPCPYGKSQDTKRKITNAALFAILRAPSEIEERFLSAQADHFAGAKWKEKASACSVRNDGLAGEPKELRRLFGLGRSGGLGAGYQARESGGVLDRDIGQDFPI